MIELRGGLARAAAALEKAGRSVDVVAGEILVDNRIVSRSDLLTMAVPLLPAPAPVVAEAIVPVKPTAPPAASKRAPWAAQTAVDITSRAVIVALPTRGPSRAARTVAKAPAASRKRSPRTKSSELDKILREIRRISGELTRLEAKMRRGGR